MARRGKPLLGLAREAKVARVSGSSLYVEMEERRGYQVGPCRWQPPTWGHDGADVPYDVSSTSVGDLGSHTHALTHTAADTTLTPPVGTRCLVLFADGRHDQPWIIAFDGWPT